MFRLIALCTVALWVASPASAAEGRDGAALGAAPAPDALATMPAGSGTPTRGSDRADPVAAGFEAAQWAFISSAGSAIRQTQARRAAGDGPLAQLLRRRQDKARAASEAEIALAALDDAATSNGPLAIRAAGEVAARQSELAAIDEQIARQHPQFARLTQPRPIAMDRVAALLEADEALIFAYTGARDTHVWVVTPTRAAWHRVGLGADTMSDSVARIRESLTGGGDLRAAAALPDDDDMAGPRIAPFNRTMAALLYAELLAPLEPVLADARHVYTVMDGPLSGLPLSLLVSDFDFPGADDDPAALRATRWLFQRHALTTLPSVDSLAAVKALALRPARALRFVGFGDPALFGGFAPSRSAGLMKGAQADPDAIRALSPLPNTRRELRRIAAALQAGPESLYLRDEATETALRAAPIGTADVLAFATHGLLSGELKGLAEPALVLTPPERASALDDGLLTASEVSALDLDAEWVVLSACNTAGPDGRPDAEGLSGLARAFLHAGARSIIVSHWPVRDDAAARLTTDMFANWTGAPGRRKSHALQAAMQAMLDDPDDPTLAHPSAWAPFALVGHGG